MRRAYIFAMAMLFLAALALTLAGTGGAAPSKPRLAGPTDAPAGLVSFRFASHEPGVPAAKLRYRCGVDSGPMVRCTSPRVVRLPAGSHRFRVQAVDPRGR